MFKALSQVWNFSNFYTTETGLIIHLLDMCFVDPSMQISSEERSIDR